MHIEEGIIGHLVKSSTVRLIYFFSSPNIFYTSFDLPKFMLPTSFALSNVYLYLGIQSILTLWLSQAMSENRQ